ncbi:MAG: FkbM family methyltransferase [Phycisphaerales bacterium]|jgi:FkbM family methyltransferase
MYSQNDEERVILEHFDRVTGRFYDIGAYDGFTCSNTLALLERGWSGVYVEPEARAFLALCATLADRRDRVTLVNAAVAADGSLAPFWECGGDMVNTMSEAHRELWRPSCRHMLPHFVKPLTPEELFDRFGPAEFISLDVEGKNMEVFRKLPFGCPEISMICVELQGGHNEMVDIAAPHGFREIHRTSENLLLVR